MGQDGFGRKTQLSDWMEIRPARLRKSV